MSATTADTFCGICVYGSDIGIPGCDSQGPAYVHPNCPIHAENPDHPYNEVRIHELHEGPMGVCACGAYRDEHRTTEQVAALQSWTEAPA